MEKLSVVSPAGQPAVKTTNAAPRLADLDGKTVGELWNGVFKGDISFPVIRRLLQAKYPRLRIIPYTEFPHHHTSDNLTQQRALARQLAELAREKGCDAVITGNGA